MFDVKLSDSRWLISLRFCRGAGLSLQYLTTSLRDNLFFQYFSLYFKEYDPFLNFKQCGCMRYSNAYLLSTVETLNMVIYCKTYISSRQFLRGIHLLLVCGHWPCIDRCYPVGWSWALHFKFNFLLVEQANTQSLSYSCLINDIFLWHTSECVLMTHHAVENVHYTAHVNFLNYTYIYDM